MWVLGTKLVIPGYLEELGVLLMTGPSPQPLPCCLDADCNQKQWVHIESKDQTDMGKTRKHRETFIVCIR